MYDRCQCDYFPIGLASLHDSCETAAMNGVGIKLKPFKFCPWCGGGVGEEHIVQPQDLKRPKHLAFQDPKTGLEYELTYDGKLFRFGKQAVLPYDFEFECKECVASAIFDALHLLLAQRNDDPVARSIYIITTWKEELVNGKEEP